MMVYDTVVIGAGVFGASIANALTRPGRRVLLVDAYGPGNSRSSSGGESRIIRMGYGVDEIYSRMAKRSLQLWQQLFERLGRPLFKRTGVLWLAREGDARVPAAVEVLRRNHIDFEQLDPNELRRRYPQMAFPSIQWGVLERESGALLARRAVQATVDDGIASGLEYRHAAVEAPRGSGAVDAITTSTGEAIAARRFVFACGPWMGKVFPELLGHRIFPSRQEVFFFGAPPGDATFASPALPVWIEPGDLYGFPDLESRGVKIACDRHGPAADPDTLERLVPEAQVEEIRARASEYLPAIANAPLVESRVCQYENTSNGDFLIDQHPDFENVWLAGGGSGHGFKHGPAVGEYVAALLDGSAPLVPRFSLAAKGTEQRRSVY